MASEFWIVALHELRIKLLSGELQRMCFAGLRFLRGELFVFRGWNTNYKVPSDITAHSEADLHNESVTHPIAYHLRRSLIFSSDYRDWNPCDVVDHFGHRGRRNLAMLPNSSCRVCSSAISSAPGKSKALRTYLVGSN